MTRQLMYGFVMCCFAFLSLTTEANAEVVRFHYSAQDLCGTTSLKVRPDGATGEWRPWTLGLRRESFYCQPKATHIVTFRHPYSCGNVKVPLALPEGTPRISYERSAVVYTYGFYTVRVEFLRDGGVDVIYNSGLFRPL